MYLGMMIWMLCLLSLMSRFYVLESLSDSPAQYTFDIPYPAGILVMKREISGYIQRIISIERSAVALRPRWAHVASMRVFSPDECSMFITRAEEYSSTVRNWGTEHNSDDELPSVDVPVRSLFSDDDFRSLEDYRRRSVLAEMLQQFNLNTSYLMIRDMFIAKYNASSMKRAHAPHKDKSAWSFIVALNNQRRKGTKLGSGFDGGGTRFIDLNEHWVQPAGEAIMFTGKTLHEGVEVTRGVRYILAGFCEYTTNWWEDYDPIYDGFAASVGVQTGDIITAIQTCHVDDNGLMLKRMQSTRNVSDEEWLRLVTSCEVMEPKGNIIVSVERPSPG